MNLETKSDEFPRVTENGLHKTEEARKKNSIFDHQAIEKQLEAAEEILERRNSLGRNVVMWSGREGQRQFEQALRDEINRQVETPTFSEPPIITPEVEHNYVWEMSGLPLVERTPDEVSEADYRNAFFVGVDPIGGDSGLSLGYGQITPEGTIHHTPSVEQIITAPSYLEMQRTALENGGIDMLTFLDNISSYDPQSNQ